MIPLLTRPPQLPFPIRGLQGIWFLGRNNLLVSPGDLTQAVWGKGAGGTGTVPVVTAGAADPLGGTSAFRVQMNLNGGLTAGDYSVFQQGITAQSNPHTDIRAVWLRSNTADTFTLRLREGTSGTFESISVTPEWQQFSLVATIASTLSNIQIITYGDSGSQAPDILVWHPQLNAGSSLFPYEDKGAQQTLPIYRGTAGTLQRGATTGAESTDPGLLNSGLSFVTDDILLSQTLAAMALGGPFTIYGVGIHNGTSTGTVLSLAAAGATTDYQRLAMNASGFVRIGSKAGAAAETNSADLAVSTTVPSVLALVHDGTTLTLHNVSAGTSVTLAAQAASGAARIGVGCTAGSTPAQQVTALTESVVAPFNVAHNAAERARMYWWLRSELAKPPYLLAVA